MALRFRLLAEIIPIVLCRGHVFLKRFTNKLRHWLFGFACGVALALLWRCSGVAMALLWRCSGAAARCCSAVCPCDPASLFLSPRSFSHSPPLLSSLRLPPPFSSLVYATCQYSFVFSPPPPLSVLLFSCPLSSLYNVPSSRLRPPITLLVPPAAAPPYLSFSTDANCCDQRRAHPLPRESLHVAQLVGGTDMPPAYTES